jgi:predicted nucleic-acid-binding Zn-ribbon protein
MYKLQWDEERAVQSDPLSILAFNAPAKQKTLAQTLGGEVLDKANTKKSQGANAHIRHEELLSRSKKEGDDARTNPFVRRQPDYSAGSDFSFSRPGETKADAMRRVNKDLALEGQEASRLAASDATADRCSSCGSAWVFICTSEMSGGTKSEVWGNKDVQTARYIQCKKCNYISQMSD